MHSATIGCAPSPRPEREGDQRARTMPWSRAVLSQLLRPHLVARPGGRAAERSSPETRLSLKQSQQRASRSPHSSSLEFGFTIMQCRFQTMSETAGRKVRAASEKPRPGAVMVAGEEGSGITRCLCEGLLSTSSSSSSSAKGLRLTTD